MRLLAIETTGAKASVALIDEAGNTRVQGSEETMNHLQHLIPMIQQLLANCELSINDINGILVSEGPGSFTGIRIGMATAKGLAQALSVPIAGVPTLRSFAYHLEREDVIACPVFDARRQQVYAGAYGWVAPAQRDGGSGDRGGRENCGKYGNCGGCGNCGTAISLVEDGAYDLKEFLGRLESTVPHADAMGGRKTVVFFGDGLDRYEQEIRRWGEEVKERGIQVEYAPVERRYQEALSVAKLGRKMFSDGKQRQFGEIEPVYLRQAEAQRKLEERLAQEKRSSQET